MVLPDVSCAIVPNSILPADYSRVEYCIME
jgi:hypothetical protein